MQKFYIYIGCYGCGKTELSMNTAIQAAREGKKTALVDLDIVNPYFRSAFHRELLEGAGVRLIASEYTLAASDVPVVSPEVNATFDGDFDVVIFDVGGDPVGATALGQYYEKFLALPPEDLNVLFVINTRRPLTMNKEDILEMLDKVQLSARIGITGFINNTNLAAETYADLLIEGDGIIREVSEETGIPVTGYGVQPEIYAEHGERLDELCEGTAILTERFTHLGWIDVPSDQA
jgi:cellulose biosynthesis protein BcsQ